MGGDFVHFEGFKKLFKVVFVLNVEANESK